MANITFEPTAQDIAGFTTVAEICKRAGLKPTGDASLAPIGSQTSLLAHLGLEPDNHPRVLAVLDPVRAPPRACWLRAAVFTDRGVMLQGVVGQPCFRIFEDFREAIVGHH